MADLWLRRFGHFSSFCQQCTPPKKLVWHLSYALSSDTNPCVLQDTDQPKAEYRWWRISDNGILATTYVRRLGDAWWNPQWIQTLLFLLFSSLHLGHCSSSQSPLSLMYRPFCCYFSTKSHQGYAAILGDNPSQKGHLGFCFIWPLYQVFRLWRRIMSVNPDVRILLKKRLQCHFAGGGGPRPILVHKFSIFYALWNGHSIKIVSRISKCVELRKCFSLRKYASFSHKVWIHEGRPVMNFLWKSDKCNQSLVWNETFYRGVNAPQCSTVLRFQVFPDWNFWAAQRQKKDWVECTLSLRTPADFLQPWFQGIRRILVKETCSTFYCLTNSGVHLA